MIGNIPEPAAPPQPGKGKRGEEGYLGYLLRQAASAYRTRADRALSDLGLTQPQFAVLTMLSAYPGLSNADLARMALLTPQTVSVIVANLEKAGCVSRQAHAVHGRIQQLGLTERGGALLAKARERVQVLEGALLEGVSPAEEAVLRGWLVRVATGQARTR